MAKLHTHLRRALLSIVPADGSAIGNTALRREIENALAAKGLEIAEDDYWQVQSELVAEGVLIKGAGRGGSVRLAEVPEDDEGADFSLEAQEAPEPEPVKAPRKARATVATSTPKRTAAEEAQIISYRHQDKRKNNPEVGMVTPATDPEAGKTRWAFDPHLDPALQFDPQRGRVEAVIDEALASGDMERMRSALEELKRLQTPYLNWAGKAERTSFEVDTVSLHVHERVDPASILSAVRKAMKGEGKSTGAAKAIQPGLFDAPFENLPLRDAIDFYHHERGWANRLVAGDSLLVMNSLLQKESMAGKVQMVYIDPPYGIKYGSNFQPFVGKRDVKDRNDADLTLEPEMIKAFRDTWELGIHSYLTYLRDRLLLARELLSESGSVFVQISDENLHHVREIMDEVFGAENFISLITFRTGSGFTARYIKTTSDYLVWYGKSKDRTKYHQLFEFKQTGEGTYFDRAELDTGRTVDLATIERDGLEDRVKAYIAYRPLVSGAFSQSTTFNIELRGQNFHPGGNRCWKTTANGLRNLESSNRIQFATNTLKFIAKSSDFPCQEITHVWNDTMELLGKDYVVQTTTKVIERCLLMTTDPGDLVLDPTCGSGTTAFVAEKWGRRWITCDTSRVAITLAKQRLMTSSFDYFDLKYPHEGLKGGFIYKTVPHVTLKSIANNPDIDSIYERMRPAIEQLLGNLNTELAKHPAEAFIVTEGGRKGKKLDFAKGDTLQEWEVPFDAPTDWPEAVTMIHDKFLHARRHMQGLMDQSIAAHADQEVLFDQPSVAKNRLRITGPFTVEAVPFPSVKALDEASGPDEADTSIARTGESGRQHQWRDELLKAGIRGKAGQMLKFADLEALPSDHDIRNLHAVGHLDSGERVVVSFGPEHAALEQRQVANALNEAGNLFPLPKMIVFCAFTFDPEAAKDIDALKGITALKAQMNTDLLTEDLKKAKSSNQSFWLMGQPEVEVRSLKDGRYEVEVHGFDYFDTVKGELVSGGKSKIAMWSLDTDYDERSVFPRQVFFPMAGKGEGWEKLKKNIRAELDESKLDKFHGTISLPFEAGDNRKIAVKIVDDRGIESLKVMSLK
ncbi:DNA methylase [Zoogloea oryzae]|uniref:site-specific DNA-methyltransferase (adenine-specific) n=1 Tax=Zoogloea oryzae TaxID=310767 RepID=A0ABQ6FAM2_9RHOO|nr:site-specific DNA-methyltransferase [Zoogloea oryzae]GLT22314.1 DNA methylase [Zoogloea oryzae]